MNDAITIPLRKRPDNGNVIGHEGEPPRRTTGEAREAQIQLLAAAATTTSFENARLNRELRLSREEARRLARKVVTVQEEERLRISRELHDEAGQALTALKFSLAALRENLSDPDAAGAQLAELVTLTDQTMDQIRRLAHDLRPCALDRYPLEEVLEGVCGEFARRTGLAIHFNATVSARISDAARISFYRFLQETLTNSAKHAGATRIDVGWGSLDGYIVLSVSDDGTGFHGAAEGVGLTGQRERFELLGGWVEIISNHDGGACVRAGIPPSIVETKGAIS